MRKRTRESMPPDIGTMTRCAAPISRRTASNNTSRSSSVDTCRAVLTGGTTSVCAISICAFRKCSVWPLRKLTTFSRGVRVFGKYPYRSSFGASSRSSLSDFPNFFQILCKEFEITSAGPIMLQYQRDWRNGSLRTESSSERRSKVSASQQPSGKCPGFAAFGCSLHRPAANAKFSGDSLVSFCGNHAPSVSFLNSASVSACPRSSRVAPSNSGDSFRSNMKRIFNYYLE